MSSESPPEDVQEPKALRLTVVGLVAVVGAVAAVYFGITGRTRTEREVAARTLEESLPPVEIILPKRGSSAQDLVLPGDIQAFATAPIYARASGYVVAWYKDIGARVKKGDKLAEIDTPDLDQQYAQGKADLASAVANEALASVTAQRYHELVGQAIVSKQTDDEHAADERAKKAAVDAAKANVARLDALEGFKTLAAPFDGIVTTRSIDVGNLINAGGNTGTALFQVADLHKMRVYVRVPQAYVGELSPGLKASLRLPQYPGQDFEATLVGTSNSITQESRTALVELQADNPDDKLWPGTYTEVHFHLDANPNALRVPATALMFGEKGVQIATVDTNQAVVLKNVQVGHDIGADVEVLAGIGPTDRLIDSPVETLNTGDKVRVVKDASEAAPKTAQSDVGKATD